MRSSPLAGFLLPLSRWGFALAVAAHAGPRRRLGAWDGEAPPAARLIAYF